MFVILLTNRVHAARAKRPATVIDDVRADLSDAAVLSVTDDPDGVLTMPAAFRADREVGWNKPLRRVRHRSKSSHPTVKKKATTSKSAITLAGKPAAAKPSAGQANGYQAGREQSGHDEETGSEKLVLSLGFLSWNTTRTQPLEWRNPRPRQKGQALRRWQIAFAWRSGK